jgi:AraC-like DNA-binding protein
MVFSPTARHLLRAKDLADARYADSLGVDEMAAAAGLSRAHFSREFRRAFGESPHAYLLTRRLERAAALLRNTDRPVTEICFAVGLQSLGSFTTSFTRTYGMSPTVYRRAFPPAAHRAVVPSCIVRAYGRPARAPRTAHLEKTGPGAGASVADVTSTSQPLPGGEADDQDRHRPAVVP